LLTGAVLLDYPDGNVSISFLMVFTSMGRRVGRIRYLAAALALALALDAPRAVLDVAIG
jgi:hypothetical protein